MASSNKAPTKTEIFNGIAEATGLNRKQVASVFEAMTAMIDKTLSGGKKTDAKSFTIPGLAKIVTKYKAAEKGGEKKTNPFTGEEMITKPKPASQQVKIRPLKALKDMVND